MLWFKDCWRNAVAKRKRGEVIQPCSEKKLSPLDVKEIRAAEKAIIGAVQGLGFYEELLSLRTVQREVKKSSSIVKLDPVFVEGIIYVGGQLHNLPIKKEVKHPVILLKDHHVSEPIMHHYHHINACYVKYAAWKVFLDFKTSSSEFTVTFYTFIKYIWEVHLNEELRKS